MPSSPELKGVGQVFRFTLAQFLKQKGNIVALILLFLFIVALGPVTALITGKTGSASSDAQLKAWEKRQEKLLETGVTEEQLASVEQGLMTVGSSWEEYQKGVPEADRILSDKERRGFDADTFSQNFGTSVVLMMLCILSVSFVVRCVVEEKASKLVDLLMVSVEPMALLIGKVLAALVYTLIYFAVQILALLVSDFIMKHVLHMDAVSGSFITLRLMDTSPKGILIFFITCALGLLAFGLLSGLAGAGCSSMEEISSAMSVAMLLCFAGYFVSMVIFNFDSRALVIVFSLLPFVSMFIMPPAVLLFDYGYWLVPLSWVIQIFTIILLALLSARVYRGLIVYKGKRLNMLQIMRMSLGKEVV